MADIYARKSITLRECTVTITPMGPLNNMPDTENRIENIAVEDVSITVTTRLAYRYEAGNLGNPTEIAEGAREVTGEINGAIVSKYIYDRLVKLRSKTAQMKLQEYYKIEIAAKYAEGDLFGTDSTTDGEIPRPFSKIVITGAKFGSIDISNMGVDADYARYRIPFNALGIRIEGGGQE